MTPREAAWTIHHRTGALVTPCTLHERAGDAPRWVVQGLHTHQPEIHTDDSLAKWAAELEAAHKSREAQMRGVNERLAERGYEFTS